MVIALLTLHFDRLDARGERRGSRVGLIVVRRR
jgi:hypothetical protein